MQLSEQEKDQLYDVIVNFMGESEVIATAKPRFNEKTVAVVEDMITQNIKCNDSIKQLVGDMLSGGRVLATGWLRRSLGAASKAAKKSSFNGLACRVTTKANWQSAIMISAL